MTSASADLCDRVVASKCPSTQDARRCRGQLHAGYQGGVAMAEPDTQSPIIPHKEPATGTDKTQAARTLNPILGFLKILGPGFITGASDDDPSGIGTYTVAGASQGFATLWMA